MAIIRSSDLDFDLLKENLKVYLQRQEEFSDYDFEGSGLSNILDVLAYNTHLNGLIANFAINESFLNTSQLRSSVLSHSEALGYYPRSRASALATVNLSIATNLGASPSLVTLPAYTNFSTDVNDITYNFQTIEAYIGYNDGTGTFNFRTSTDSNIIPLYEGKKKTKTFLVAETTNAQVYVIPDENADTDTLSVKVYETPTSTKFETYIEQTKVARIDNTSKVYGVRETPNGFFEVFFSDGNVLGVPPKAGNKIIIEYISTNGEAANTASTFTCNSSVSISGASYNVSVTAVTEAAGGSEKETVESIKLNAPLSFAAQQRMVTAEDYKVMILKNYSAVLKDVVCWGGQDNVPPLYGAAFVSLNFKDSISDAVKTQTKNSIIANLSNNLSVLSIETKYYDPAYAYLEFACNFEFDPSLTGFTAETAENLIQSEIQTYATEELGTFDKTYRRSNLLARIDDISPAILNSSIVTKVQRRFSPSTTIVTSYEVQYPTQIAAPDNIKRIITSGVFTYLGESAFLTNRLGSNNLEIINLTGELLADNVGSYNATKGIIQIIGFKPDSYIGTEIKLTVVPANESTIRPLRNYILDVDLSSSFATASIDYQNTKNVIA